VTPFGARVRAIADTAVVVKPAGAGPFPVLVQLHGCGGRGENQLRWAQRARAEGWAACILDSFAFRGIRRPQAVATVCTGLRLWGRERAGDLFAGLAWLRGQPWADAGCMVLAGWSHGGWTVAEAMAMGPQLRARCTGLEGLPEQPLAGVVGAFLLYPYLGRAALAPRLGLAHRAPVLAIVAGRDATVGVRAPLAALRALQASGADVRVAVFERATHDFDEPCSEGGLRAPGSRYDAALTGEAEALLLNFLQEAAALTGGPKGPP
jgi:dienelactone hydrolase